MTRENRNEPVEFEVDWDEFGRIVIERWQNKLLDKDIFDTGTLYRSIEYGYRTMNANNVAVGRGAGRIRTTTVPDMMYFSFPMYGIYVEKGVGRGYDRGNIGLVKFEGKGRGRERRTWYFRIFANQRHRLGELVGEVYGRQAMSMIHTIESRSFATPKQHYQ